MEGMILRKDSACRFRQADRDGELLSWRRTETEMESGQQKTVTKGKSLIALVCVWHAAYV